MVKINFRFVKLLILFTLLLGSLLITSQGCSWFEDDESESVSTYSDDDYADFLASCDASFTYTTPNDYYFSTYQWHLENTGQLGATSGEDINVVPAWSTTRGECIIVQVVDDGSEYSHEDLTNNNIPGLNHAYAADFQANGEHGTAVSGVIAAEGWNSIGVIGVAPKAKFAANNMLYSYSSSNEYDAMTRNKKYTAVSNNSWGPTDNTGELSSASSLWESGIDEGISTGRDGKGTVYVWAAGNGGQSDIDNSNYDGYANYYGVIAVGAINPQGEKSYYSENGANVWVGAYSGGYNSSGYYKGITTTDLTAYGSGYDGLANDDYTNQFGGTSAAAPVVSGVVALMLSVNPALTWRDVKIILAESARKNDFYDSGWTTNGGTKIRDGSAYNINYKYGFGVVNADAAVTLAQGWTNVGPLLTYSSSDKTSGATITDNNSTGINSTIDVSGSSINEIEYVEINIDITHSDAGNLEITLTSPDGTGSILAEQHNCYTSGGYVTSCSGFIGGSTFRFGSARHLGETAEGTWTLTVKDLESGTTGTLNSWNLKFYGRKK